MKTASFFLLCYNLLVSAQVKDVRLKETRIVSGYDCGEISYLCSNNVCIQEEWMCDTENDCGNNEDEVGCPTDCSGAHQFKCGMGNRCIAIEYRCDGKNDCVDGFDEAGCATWACLQGELKCSNNVCVEISNLCNGHNDCGNGWDEDPTNCKM